MFTNVFDVIKDVVSKVQKHNKENPNVETADGSVFDSIKNSIEAIKDGALKNKPQTQESGTSNSGNVFDTIQEQLKNVQKTNEADPAVPTADSSVFNDLQAQIKKLQEENDKLAQQQANSNVSFEEVTPLPTKKFDSVSSTSGPADEFRNPLENIGPPTSVPTPTPTPNTSSGAGEIAVTNSGGGSLGMRGAPDMGAPTKDVRVPDMTQIRVLQYSENQINLDGKNSRWALVDYNGNQGWIPEIYLNFN